MADYSKFDKLIQEEEEREKKEKEEERLRLRLKYEKEQREKQEKWDEKLIKEGKDPVKERQKYGGCAFSQMSHMMKHAANDENHSDSHNHHNHDHHNHHNHDQKPPKSSCGYMPIEEIKRLNEEKKKKDEISLEEKNKKKIAAVYAAKEDGNRLFKEKNYDLAYKVYERGILIINGMYELTESDEDEMERIECLLDLNMALTSLKLTNYTEAINCCKMAIQIDDKNTKAYYRWSEALICMAEYDKARKQTMKAKQLEPKNIAMDKQLNRINQLQKQQIEKAKKEEQKIAKRIRHKLNI